MGGAPPLAQRLPPAPPARPPQRFPLPRSAAATQRPPAGPTPHAWTSAARPRPPLFTLPAHHHARRALGPPASPPDAYLRRFAATRHTRDITSVIMEYWLRWAPARLLPSAQRLPPFPALRLLRFAISDPAPSPPGAQHPHVTGRSAPAPGHTMARRQCPRARPSLPTSRRGEGHAAHAPNTGPRGHQ